MRHIFFGICVLLMAIHSSASLRIPESMTQDERQETLRLLGLGASSKVLSDPYPLGGYSGFEVGMSAETLPAGSLNRFGDHVNNSTSDFAFQNLSIGKGLYHDVDVFVDFTPWGASDGITAYGGQLRWSFYQAKYMPMNYSLVVHTNLINVHNALVSSSLGGDLLTSVHFHDYSVFFGLGAVRATGNFEPDFTDTNRNEIEEVSELHTVIGGAVRIHEAFLTLEMDRYTVSIYSARLGLRF